MARATFKIEKPKELQATLTMTMTLGQWLDVDRSLQAGGPAYGPVAWLREAIGDVARQAITCFEVDDGGEIAGDEGAQS